MQKTNAAWIEYEKKHTANSYGTLPLVLERGQGLYSWDIEGRKYIDFLQGISACNQGHCHPKIVEALKKQADILCQPSRTFYTPELAKFSDKLCNLLGYDLFLPSSGGTEACESACKLARRWGYVVKGVEEDKAEILMTNGCFWGRSITACSGSDDLVRYKNFGPLTPGFPLVDYGDAS